MPLTAHGAQAYMSNKYRIEKQNLPKVCHVLSPLKTAEHNICQGGANINKIAGGLKFACF